MERRTFIRYVGTLTSAALIAPELTFCTGPDKKRIPITRTGADMAHGHLVRNPAELLKLPVQHTIHIPILIVGGGISGLSAGRYLHRHSSHDFKILELHDYTGGNSAAGQLNGQHFPLGAHYLPLLNKGNEPLAAFLKEAGIITGESEGKYTYDPLRLSHDPQERLLIRGVFQEGLIPQYGITPAESAEINRFMQLMQSFRDKRNVNGQYIFDIPLSNAGFSEELLQLDNQTFDSFLTQHAFRSEPLRWYLNYCCLDDFGAGTDKVSALAGIRYFAARRPVATDVSPSAVITSPEGNGQLVRALENEISEHIQTGNLVFSVEETHENCTILTYDIHRKEVTRYIAKKCILSCPSYVATHILRSPHWPSSLFEGYTHHPWLTGTVFLRESPGGNGLPLAWDNVAFGQRGLGYIHNGNQSLTQKASSHAVTLYYAFDLKDDIAERKRLFSLDEEALASILIKELETIHPGIHAFISSVTVQLWGHGMVTPYPGSHARHIQFLTHAANTSSHIYPVHTDYAGYSVFEEAFDAGNNAAYQLLNTL